MRTLKKSKFTKILSLTLALIFIMSAFAGCGGKKEEETTQAPTTTQPTTEEVVIRNPLTGEKGVSLSLPRKSSVHQDMRYDSRTS